jgi:glucokinase
MSTSQPSGATRPLVAGVDLGGTKIETIVVADGEMLGQARLPTPPESADAVAEAIAETVRSALEAADADESALAAIGIGSPGRAADGIVSHSPNVAGMQEPYPLGEAVSKLLGGPPVTIDNDVTVATLGELQRGAGRPYHSLLTVFVGTGVGGGLVFDDSVWRGRGAAGEIGHVTVKPEGRRCGCGGRGHLESYAGRASMQAKAERLVAEGQHTVLFELMAKHGRDRMTSGIIDRALKHGDAMTERLMGQAVWALGLGLSSAQNLLDVEAIVIGGGLAERFGQPFVDRIAAAMAPLLFTPPRPPAVHVAELGDLAGAMGAVMLASN